jgi:hypothetical protein
MTRSRARRRGFPPRATSAAASRPHLSGRQLRAAVEDEPTAPKLQLVARSDVRGLRQPPAVQPRPVRRARVAKLPPSVDELDHRVYARDGRIGNDEVAAGRAAERLHPALPRQDEARCSRLPPGDCNLPTPAGSCVHRSQEQSRQPARPCEIREQPVELRARACREDEVEAAREGVEGQPLVDARLPQPLRNLLLLGARRAVARWVDGRRPHGWMLASAITVVQRQPRSREPTALSFAA